MKNILALFLSLVLILLIDQVLFYNLAQRRSHILFCMSKNCQKTPFKDHKRVGFLIDPQKKGELKSFAKSPVIPPHEDYQLDKNGFRISKLNDSSKEKVINLYGDSFTFGLFLKEGKTISDRLNEMSKSCHFRNYGVPAFDLWQMVKLKNTPSLVEKADFHLFLFITDDIMRMTRPLEIHSLGRNTRYTEMIALTGLVGEVPAIEVPLFLIRNSYFFQKLYSYLDEKWWHSIDAKKVVDFFAKREEKSQFFHLGSTQDYYINKAGKVVFNPLFDLSNYTSETYKDWQDPWHYFIRDDGHPNSLGTIFYAKEIMKQIKDICPR